MKWLAKFLNDLFNALGKGTDEPVPPPQAPKPAPAPSLPAKPPLMNPQQLLYVAAKDSIGSHMTLDDTVDKSVGCAEAVCAVLKVAGVPGIPPKGIAGTAALVQFLRASPHFTEIDAYETGAVLVSPTGGGNGKIRGHTGICADYGILSNESQTGLWKEQWNFTSWKTYFSVYGGIPMLFFRYRGV